MLICVDLQRCFVDPNGCSFKERRSIEFINRTLLPSATLHDIRIAEIVSDYRQPRRGDSWACTCPGTWGGESVLPEDIKLKPVWIKAHNAPSWIRASAPPLKPPHPDPGAFDQWLNMMAGPPDADRPVVLCGLTLDCCVLCVAQELAFRGYPVRILEEGVDVYSGSTEEKRRLLDGPMLGNWARPIRWNEFIEQVQQTGTGSMVENEDRVSRT